MTYRLFEEKHHASIYQRYRFVPPEEIRDIILHYLERKKVQPHALAVDLGCGTGQNSRLMAPHFQEVVGIDISECQLEEARAVAGFNNITYRKGTAEELPFPDASVDLLTAASAAHWFDQQRFLLEAGRVLKPCGCMALLGFADNFRLHYGSCGDRLTDICDEFKKVLLPYTSTQVAVANTKLQELYTAIPFPDKERIECIPLKQQISVRNIVGFMESFSMYQALQRAEPDAATTLLQRTLDRFLKEMGVTSPDTLMEVTLEYFCVLASKPE
ncbi:putative methyltransferase DDB_G0268948 [Oncorhynchus tshawytscha]|uniref:putative methyltransferase DDB_G0268948 n=1 Tax=Oncorhynchus tshawytscha TaxID=74940 RepID=UPI001C3CF833|nr:putative methyltransferase DDB_G0268948 [Oncorhynchus tshawytscha]